MVAKASPMCSVKRSLTGTSVTPRARPAGLTSVRYTSCNGKAGSSSSAIRVAFGTASLSNTSCLACIPGPRPPSPVPFSVGVGEAPRSPTQRGRQQEKYDRDRSRGVLGCGCRRCPGADAMRSALRCTNSAASAGKRSLCPSESTLSAAERMRCDDDCYRGDYVQRYKQRPAAVMASDADTLNSFC
jgi:hypothetical protein